MRIDAESKSLSYENTGATQPSDRWKVLLPIDPSHIYAVEFAPSFRTTPPATMPSRN